ncbi:hypothetical protein N9R08_01780 [Flavobacteriaceae bacterium]|nr:hypothetical protein [Flavobacteriaceae bacterium]
MKKSSVFILFLLLACSKNATVPEEPAPIQYTLTLNAEEGGTISPDANGAYNEGATITITATPNSGYVFDRWEGTDNDDLPNGCWAGPGRCRASVTMNSNRDVQAFFKVTTSE